MKRDGLIEQGFSLGRYYWRMEEVTGCLWRDIKENLGGVILIMVSDKMISCVTQISTDATTKIIAQAHGKSMR